MRERENSLTASMPSLLQDATRRMMGAFLVLTALAVVVCVLEGFARLSQPLDWVAIGLYGMSGIAFLRREGDSTHRWSGSPLVAPLGLLISATYIVGGRLLPIPVSTPILVCALCALFLSSDTYPATVMALPALTVACIVSLQDGQTGNMSLLVVTAGILVAASVVGRRALGAASQQSIELDKARWASSEFAKLNIRLQETMTSAVVKSETQERRRIAGQIHDMVGYTLTAVLVQVRAIKRLLSTADDDMRDRLDGLESIVQSTIQEVRREVSTLRSQADEDDADWENRWAKMCRLFADFTGVQLRFRVEDDVEDIHDSIGIPIYRILQEAITNAYRHGRASVIDIVVAMKTDRGIIEIRVSDNGIGCAKVEPGSGLLGMRERVDLLGGSIVWDTLPNAGFDIGIVIPLDWGKE